MGYQPAAESKEVDGPPRREAILAGVLPPVLRSSLLTRAGFRHAFFTREGGVSEGAYATLNFAWSTGDDEARVRENLARAARLLEIAPGRLFFLSQVHGVTCREVSSASPWEEVVRTEGDALVSTDPAVACAVRSADCVPILIADERSGAACAVHSGWRGAVSDAAAAGVRALGRRAGGEARLIAAIGPHISAGAFEVSPEVALELEAASPCPGVVDRSGPRPRVDLRTMVEAQLLRAGVAEVDHVPGCTVSSPELFFSYRRDGARSGRHLSAVVPRPAQASS